MAKTAIIQVINNRMRFKCGNCGAKRSSSVLSGVRRKSMQCHKCKTTTRCTLNRRVTPRESQCGKVLLITSEGRELEVNIHDISRTGFGLVIPLKVSRARKILKGQKVRFNCRWNPTLMGSGYYQVVSNDGQRIGVKRII